MKPLKDATEKDILELKKRLKRRKDQRILDRDAQEAINIVNIRNRKVANTERYIFND